MDITTLLPVFAVLFVGWLIVAYKLRHEARRSGVFEIWKIVLKIIALLLILTLISVALQYLVVGEYWSS